MDIRRLGHTTDLLGESPCWDVQAQALCWIDALAGTLRRLFPATSRAEAHALPPPVGSIALCASGAVLVALKDRFGRYDPASGTLQSLASIPVDHPNVRLNDGKCDPWGNFVAGTMHIQRQTGEPALGGLYRLRPDRTVERLADDIAFTNGPCFSPEGRTLYVADTVVRTIWAYDYTPEGPLRNRRPFARTDALGSGPDGATVDADGCVWTVLVRTGQLARFTPAGRLERMVTLPATHPTSLCFGGPWLETAYVTSISRSTQLTGARPDDGGLFEVRGLPAPGMPANVFADG